MIRPAAARAALLGTAGLILTGHVLAACTFGTEEAAYPAHYHRTKACLDALDAARTLIDGPLVAPPDPEAIRLLMDDAFNAGLHNDDVAWLQVQHQVKALSLATEAQSRAADKPLVAAFHDASIRCEGGTP